MSVNTSKGSKKSVSKSYLKHRNTWQNWQQFITSDSETGSNSIFSIIFNTKIMFLKYSTCSISRFIISFYSHLF